MKKHICCFLAIVMLLSSFSPMPYVSLIQEVLADEPGAVLSVTDAKVRPGEEFTVGVSIANNPGLAFLNFAVQYDHEKLSLTGFSNSGWSGWTVGVGKGEKAVWASEDVSDFNGEILTLKFQALQSAQEGPTEITLGNPSAYDVDYDIPVTANTATITIFSRFPGDANDDGNLDGRDLVRMKQYFAGYGVAINELNADVNNNGSVDGRDVIRMCQYFAGYEVVLEPTGGTQHSHVLTENASVAATCIKSGNIAYWYCTGCKKYYADANATREITLADTVVEAKGHTPVVDPAVPATYESTGLTEGSHCGVCGEVLVSQDVIPVLNGDVRHSIRYDIANGDSYLAKQAIANPNPAFYVEGSAIQLSSISTPGYIFLGWYDGAGNDAVRIRKIDAASTEDYELYAHWQKTTYKVQFVSNLYPIEPIYYTVDTGAVLPSPTLSNYVFTGWVDDEGNIFKQTKIPVGMTGHMTLTANWMSERNKKVTYTNLSDPIIYEDESKNRIYFAYEIGEVQNVPLQVIKDFGYISGDGITKDETSTYSMTVSQSLVEAYAHSLTLGTTESTNWTLSSGWTESTSVDKQWCDEHGIDYSEAETRGKTEEGNWLISNSKGGSYTASHLNTNQSNRINEVKMNESSTYSESDKLSTGVKSELKSEIKTEAKAGFGIDGFGASASVSTGVSATISGEISAEESHSSSQTKGLEIGSSSSNTNITTDSASSSSSWNNSSSYGGSTSLSTNKTTAYALAEKISEKTGYGQSYIKNGNQSNTAETSHTQEREEEYSTTTTYSTVTGQSITSNWTTKGTKPGYHRWVVAGSMHVFGVVGYDMRTKSFFVDIFSMMDDYTYEFEDYSYNSSTYNDNQTGLISFSVPTYVTEYVAKKTNFTEGLKIDQATGVITEYNGTDDGVFIPDYMPVYSYTASNGVVHYDIVKVTGIASTAFAGNENIVAVVLPDAVTEIPDGAFAGCTSLIGVVGGRGISVIGDNAFSGCTSIVCAAVHSNVTSLGTNAFVGANKLLVNAANASVAEAALASGARNIVLYTNHLAGGAEALKDKVLVIPEGTESVELNGVGQNDSAQTFTNIKIKSDAGKTVLNKMNLDSDTGVPLQISSPEVVLNQVAVTSNNFAAVLTANRVNLGLQGTVQMTSDTQNTMVLRDASLYESVGNAVGKLSLSGNMLVCGDVSNQGFLARIGAEIKNITEEDFNKYIGGVIVIELDVNGGNSLATTTMEAFRNCQVGTLPTPTREYYSFAGWYTAPTGGTQVTEASSLDRDTILYAQWIARTYEISFNSNGGGGSYSPITAYCDRAIGNLPTATRSLYTFDGWYTAATGGEKITSNTVRNKAENFTVYAHWIPNRHKVTFAPNGDGVTLSETSRTITCDAAIGTLPTPIRDYYTFDGWYTQSSGGTKYTASTVVSIDADFTLYAHWTIHPLKDWTLASNVPSGAKIEQEKWTYTKTSYTESTNSSMSGWTPNGDYWKQTGSGSKNYASFPGGFDTGHWIYKDFMKGPYTASDNGSTKREVSNAWAGYVYWHWMYDTSYANGHSQRPIDNCYEYGPDNGYLYKFFGAFTSTKGDYSYDSWYCNSKGIRNYIVPEKTSWDECQGATRWFRFDYYKSSYTDYQKIYKYIKVENLESFTPVSPSDTITNVQRWVRYRER